MFTEPIIVSRIRGYSLGVMTRCCDPRNEVEIGIVGFKKAPPTL